MRELLEIILKSVQKEGFGFQGYEDLYYICKEAMKTDVPLGVEFLKLLSAECEKSIRDPSIEENDLRKLLNLHKRVLLAAAQYDFESYLLYVEWNRNLRKSSTLPGGTCPKRSTRSF